MKKAGPGPMPRWVEPMIPREVPKPFNRQGWFFELKYDGFRAIAEVDEGRARLYSRQLRSFTEQFLPVVRSLQAVTHQLILDGELAVVDEEGRTHFDWIKNYHTQRSNPGKLGYFVFDILYLDGYNLMELPLRERKEILGSVTPDLPNIVAVSHIETEGEELFKKIKEQGLEGMVAKNPDSTYIPGREIRQWLKVKNYIRRGWKKIVYKDV